MTTNTTKTTHRHVHAIVRDVFDVDRTGSQDLRQEPPKRHLTNDRRRIANPAPRGVLVTSCDVCVDFDTMGAPARLASSCDEWGRNGDTCDASRDVHVGSAP